FNRNERIVTPSVEKQPRLIVQHRLAALAERKDRVDHIGADDGHQKIMEHNPLVVPPDELLHGLEPLVWMFVADLIVEPQQRGLELRDDHVLVVSRIPDHGPRPRVGAAALRRAPWHVARIRIGGIPGESASELEVPAVGLVQVRLIVRSAAVDIVEIELRTAEVNQRIRVVLLHQRAGWIKRQVMIDELAEIRVAGGDALVLFVVDLRFRSRLLLSLRDHQRRQRVQRGFRKARRAEPSKHPTETSLEERRVRRKLRAPNATVAAAYRQPWHATSCGRTVTSTT